MRNIIFLFIILIIGCKTPYKKINIMDCDKLIQTDNELYYSSRIDTFYRTFDELEIIDSSFIEILEKFETLDNGCIEKLKIPPVNLIQIYKKETINNIHVKFLTSNSQFLIDSSILNLPDHEKFDGTFYYKKKVYCVNYSLYAKYHKSSRDELKTFFFKTFKKTGKLKKVSYFEFCAKNSKVSIDYKQWDLRMAFEYKNLKYFYKESKYFEPTNITY